MGGGGRKGGDSWGIGPGWERQEVGEEDETGRSRERETGDVGDKYWKWFKILHSSSIIVKKVKKINHEGTADTVY